MKRNQRQSSLPLQLSLLLLPLCLTLFAFAISAAPARAVGSGSISLTTLGTPVSEDFNTLASSGTSSGVLPTGWYFNESLTNANITYTVGTGSSTSGDTYSFGITGTNPFTDRAFGTLRSGSLSPTIGAVFTNNTGALVTSVVITYTGEMWRAGVTNRNAADRLDFQYSTNGVTLTTGTWTDVDALDYSSSVISTTSGAKDGNSPSFRTVISSSISGLSIPNGSTFAIRWMDFDITSSDDGLAIDDFSLTPQGGVSTNPGGTGAAAPSALLPNGSTLLAVTVTLGTFPASTGVTVTCDLTAIGGSSTQIFYDDGTNGDVTALNNTFSFSATVAVSTTAGVKSLSCIIGDAQSRTGSAAIGLTVLAILPIGTVNGPITNATDAPTHNAAYLGQIVTVQGVIYERTRQAISNSSNYYNGFFIQNTAALADVDPNTSDGLFVFMNTPATIPGPGGAYTPTIGDEVVLVGTISEFFNMTELQAPNLALISVVRSGVNLDAEIPAFVANPPNNLDDANRYWERLQGMRGQVPINSIVLNGRNVFSPADAEIWLARSDSTIAARVDPYARRAFRDAHTLDDNFNPTTWDGNGYRILMGSLGIKFTQADAQALLAPARTFMTVTNAPIGGVNYSFSKYRLEVITQPTLTNGVDPAANNPPSVVDRSRGYSIADYNLENLYDYRDNPFSGCDFTGGANTGCAARSFDLGGVSPPYDYVPADDTTYQARLTDIAKQIINDLHSPDIIMAQEVENQDICVVSAGALVCGVTDNADGKPDVLQELALKIVSLAGPAYDAAFDRDSSDLRGIAPAFLYRTDRVQLVPAQTNDPVLGNNPIIGYAGAAAPFNTNVSNPKTLNATSLAVTTGCETTRVFPRPPDIGLFRIYRANVGVGDYADVYLINNHFKSTPTACVLPRTEQAKYNAAIVQAIQAAKPAARVLVGGDLNVYPRPDDPFAPIGQPTSSDQLGALYAPSLGLKNLWEVELAQVPASAYSYDFQGQAQTIDQMLVNVMLLNELTEYRTAHINSDFPADYTGDVARGTSDHDPSAAVFRFPTTKLYLPLVFRNYTVAPDLIVQSITPTPGNIQVVIKNQGNSAVVNEFWVDLYVNPSPVPTAVNQIWPYVSSRGAVWGITSAGLASLGPNGTLTLNLGDAYYQPTLSTLGGTFPAGTKIYVQVDSANTLTTYGGVLENHEMLGGPYNNITGITLGSPITLAPTQTGSRPGQVNHLPPRK